jgi:NADPH2:quinone reductase
MKAMRVHAPGGPEALRYEEVERPVPGPGQVVVKIEAAGVNFIDVYQRTGLYKVPLPFTLGQEAAGTVTAVGPGVAQPNVGDRVAYTSVLGAYAEYAIVPADRVVVLPDGVSTRQGAAAMLQGMTAHYLATSTYPLKPGDACLVHAAAGGVGLLLCQIAKQRGARVLGTVSTEQKAKVAREAGASEAILYTQIDFAKEVQRLTDGRGVDVVYDSVGQTTFAKGLDCLRPRGTMVVYGQASGPVAPVDTGLLSDKGCLYLTRVNLGTYTATRQELEERSGDIFNWVSSGRLKVHVCGARAP